MSVVLQIPIPHPHPNSNPMQPQKRPTREVLTRCGQLTIRRVWKLATRAKRNGDPKPKPWPQPRELHQRQYVKCHRTKDRNKGRAFYFDKCRVLNLICEACQSKGYYPSSHHSILLPPTFPHRIWACAGHFHKLIRDKHSPSSAAK